MPTGGTIPTGRPSARRPWTGPVDYCTISEMGPVLSALNRMIERDKSDTEALDRELRLVLFLQMASQYPEQMRYTGETKTIDNIEYPVIYPR